MYKIKEILEFLFGAIVMTGILFWLLIGLAR